MGKCLIILAGLIIPLAFVGNILEKFGAFRRIETQGLDKCQLRIPEGANELGFEDMAMDYEKGIAYLSGDDRSWFHLFNLFIPNIQKQGNIYAFDIESETFRKINLINYPYEHFHPLGLGLLKATKNQLFMTNFRINNGETVGAVEIFELDPKNENQLIWIESVVHPLFTVPDDVLAIDENTFYVTNVYHYRSDRNRLLHTVEIITLRSWTELMLCSKTNGWQCSRVVDSVSLANGIASSLDFKTVYLAASNEKAIRVYERHLENNSLTYIRTHALPFLPDNIIVNERDEVIVAGHPKAIEFLFHSKDPRNHRSSSEVVLFPYPKTNSTYNTLLVTNGELLSASSVAGTYKYKLLVGAFTDPGILLCKNLH